MTTLNAVFECKLALEDEGYESGSEKFQDTYATLKNTENSPHLQYQEGLSTLFQLHHAVLENLTSDLYAGG